MKKILYVANHNQKLSNDDEGAVTYALQKLGHEVVLEPEKTSPPRIAHLSRNCDFLLFHKWQDTRSMAASRCPNVMWYFDLVDHPDPTLRKRCNERKDWMRRTLPLVQKAFCTDGDWVANNAHVTNKGTPRLHWMPQGADERMLADPDDVLLPENPKVLVAASARGGVDRDSFLEHMKTWHSDRLVLVHQGVYREKMAELVHQCGICVCPDAPVTPRYASNRVFNMAGFGGLVFHPRCEAVSGWYARDEVVQYRNRQDLDDMLNMIYGHVNLEAWSRGMRYGLRRTIKDHTYRHRVVEMLACLEEEGII